MSEHEKIQTQNVELLACTEPGCERTDLRGEVGRHMHIQRAHKRNWSTRKRGT